MTLVDTNILVDILTSDRHWADWSSRRLSERSKIGPLIINDVIFAELSAGMESEDEAERTLSNFRLALEPFDRSTLFVAGQSFQAYRARGGKRTSVLPDFFIGAQARTLGCPILTRDVGRYRTYYPDVLLITPA